MRILEAWNSVQCEGNSPGYVLGAVYDLNGEFTSEFLAACESCVWLMYRTQFKEPIIRHPDGPSPLLSNLQAVIHSKNLSQISIPNSNAFSSDIGWGCMIRTGQSMLANTLLILHNCRTLHKSKDAIKILRFFSDEPQSPFSIHNFVEYGQKKCGKLPGEWFGPSAVSQCISKFAPSIGLHCYVSNQDIYLQQLPCEFPLLVLCNIRLGLNSLNPLYEPGLKHLLKSSYSVGIAGGRTSASLYFYGFQGSNLLYHDPHEPKYALNIDTKEDELWTSTHSNKLRSLKCSEMDPSMLAGFLLKSKEDVQTWTNYLMELEEELRVIHVFMEEHQCAMHEKEESGWCSVTMDETRDLSES